MAAADEEKPSIDRRRLGELKKRLSGLPRAERVAQEVRTARELGITVTATEAASIGVAIEQRNRAPLELIFEPARLYDRDLRAGHEGGQGVDLGPRRSIEAELTASGFMRVAQLANTQELLRQLGDADTEELVTRLEPQLELFAALGGRGDVIRQAKKAYAKVVFASVDPKSGKDITGKSNT